MIYYSKPIELLDARSRFGFFMKGGFCFSPPFDKYSVLI